MSHSAEQKRKKDHARTEAFDHLRNASVANPRQGRDHESHKVDDMTEDDKARLPNGMTNAY
jgi:hypothetical protein